jgi:hypothetical protein
MITEDLQQSRASVRLLSNQTIAGTGFLLSLFLLLSLNSASAASPATPGFAKLPLSFEPNRGQADSRVQFLSRGPDYTLYLTAGEAILRLQQQDLVDMQLLGANVSSTARGLEPQPGIVNYIAGNDPRKWQSGIPTYAKVSFANVYPGIDLVFYGNRRQLEYDFVIAPGADPRQIAWKIPRASLRLDDAGNLLLQNGPDPASFLKPTVYQIVNGKKASIEGRYVIAGDRVRFALGKFDHTQPLIIDPVLTYATYLGGAVSESSATNGNTQIGALTTFGASGVSNPTQGIAVDSQGEVYVTGYTNSTSFPLENAYVSSSAGNASDPRSTAAFVTKFNAQGTGLVYSTYLAGTTTGLVNTVGTAIAVDAGGNAYVAGYTDDGTFPVTGGAYQTICGANYTTGASGVVRINGCALEANVSGFVTKLSPSGTPVYSTFLGASSDQIYAIAVDASGQAYVAGYSSDACTNSQPAFYCFPTTANAVLPGTASYVYVQPESEYMLFTGMAFVSVLDGNGANLLYSTYVGDNTALIANGTYSSTSYGPTNATAVSVDSAGEFFLAGITEAPNMPTTAGAYQPTPSIAGCCVGFVAKFAPIASGPGLEYLTYLGGPDAGSSVFPSGIVADSAGETYVAGTTTDQNFPTTAGAYQNSCGFTGDTFCDTAFVTKFNATGAFLEWSTMLGDILNSGDSGVSAVGPILLDSQQNVYVTGTSTNSAGVFPQVNALQPPAIGSVEPFITEFNPTGSQILFSTFLGGQGTGSQYAAGLAMDGSGNLYLAGNTNSGGIPGTAGTFQPSFVGFGDGYIAKISTTLAQTITFSALPNVTYGVSPITLGATASSGLAVSYSVTGPATVSGSTLTITGAGNVSVTASQVGNSTYSAASPVTQGFTVTPALLTVTAASPNVTYGQAVPALTYSLSGFVYEDTAAVVSGAPAESTTATSTSAPGGYPVTIAQGTLSAANYTFKFVNGTLTIAHAAQTITFGALPNVPYGTAPITLAATASSGLAVSYSVTGPATLSSSKLTITGVGPVTVIASQAGNADYGAATPVSRSFTVTAASQTITFGAIPAQTVGGSVSLSASATSGLTVSFSSLTTAVCTVSGITAKLLTTGTCSIQASQSGNADYLAAVSVKQNFTVSSAADFTITADPGSETAFRGILAAFLLEIQSVDGFKGDVKLGCSGGPEGAECADLPQTVSVNGTAWAISGILFPASTTPGTYTITFTGTSGSVTASATAQFIVK